ncbi:hypothetical protein GOP47_0001685 [Adiantum capillus-veneris]|uniref:Uncharacterized protein n=1 Tax=Adiantum capillus-veneris TaxID=13818 RepID=A0A9D4VAI8_ADICA|nr:hypothetical protein GOP47_0001685 [Adiantum capillus-veneris]
MSSDIYKPGLAAFVDILMSKAAAFWQRCTTRHFLVCAGVGHRILKKNSIYGHAPLKCREREISLWLVMREHCRSTQTWAHVGASGCFLGQNELG